MSDAEMTFPPAAKGEKQSPLVTLLSRLNRKERYWLLSDALGKPMPALSPDYRERLRQVIGVEIPENAWWAMDYHFDWLHAALSSWPNFDIVLPHAPQPNGVTGKNDKPPITGTQEDIDLLIAFGDTLILVEAKAATGWTNAQMASKAKRLANLPARPESVKIYFVLTSPNESERLKAGSWINDIPVDMRKENKELYFVELIGYKENKNRLRVERFHVRGEKPGHDSHWHFIRA